MQKRRHDKKYLLSGWYVTLGRRYVPICIWCEEAYPMLQQLDYGGPQNHACQHIACDWSFLELAQTFEKYAGFFG